MPTFETNSGAETAAAERLAATQEFRPRKRDWKGNLDETFNPAPIPPEVKKAIDQRVDNIMRQCRGPDETLFALREWWSGSKRIAARLWDLLTSRLPWRSDEDDEEEAEETVLASAEGGPRAGKSAGQNSAPQRARRGRRRHGRRGGNGNGGNDKGGSRDWRENSY